MINLNLKIKFNNIQYELIEYHYQLSSRLKAVEPVESELWQKKNGTRTF